jgi:sigma-E factor negative regulatory protein RseC
LEETGEVIRTEGDMAFVKVRRSSACGTCSSKGACHSLGGGGDLEVDVVNRAGASVGDRVVLEIPTSSVVKIAFLVYMVPVVGLVAGALLGLELGKAYGVNSELCALGGSLILFALAFTFVKVLGTTMGEKPVYRPEIKEKL